MARAAFLAGRDRRQSNVLGAVVLAVTAALAVIFTATVDGFATLGNLQVILSNSVSLVILSCGMAVVIISRGLDLSLIAQMVAGAATFSILIDAGLPGAGAILLTVLVMIGVGLLNGWLIAYAEIPAILATLASAMLITGLFRFGVLQGEYLLLLPTTNPAVAFLSIDLMPGIGMPVLVMGLVLLATWGLLHHTVPGRIIHAMGDNFQTARLTGLPVRRVTLVVYVFAALTALIAGLVMSAASGTVDFRTVTNGSLLFEVILVVVLGGIPLRGGRGGVTSILIGALLIAVLRNGMTLLDFSSQTQDVLKGLVLLTAIVADLWLNPRDTETDTVGDL
jgi:ribose transport system permease protein